MKKSLLALAVMGAFAGTASAQTNVTVYGLVDIGVERTDTDATEAKWGLDSGLQSGNRLGFKGSEDLGGGLSAIFTLESGFKLDTGDHDQGGLLFGRQAWVGLNGGFGTVKFGRQYNPLYTAVAAIDPFSTGLAGNLTNTVNIYGFRTDNTINYSLAAGPFSGQVAYGFGEVAGDNSANRQVGLSFGYANGPVSAIIAYHSKQNATGTANARTTFLGGTYNFGVVKAHASYADNRADGQLGTIGKRLGLLTDAQATALASDETLKTRDYMLGVSAPVGAGSVLASFQRKDDKDSSLEYDLFAVGYEHNLSKRTNLYTSYGHGQVSATGVDEKENKFNVGIRHKF
jgi:predicted porin